jgi:hypothetical protein
MEGEVFQRTFVDCDNHWLSLTEQIKRSCWRSSKDSDRSQRHGDLSQFLVWLQGMVFQPFCFWASCCLSIVGSLCSQVFGVTVILRSSDNWLFDVWFAFHTLVQSQMRQEHWRNSRFPIWGAIKESGGYRKYLNCCFCFVRALSECEWV